jgi:hypothetical protein
VDVLSGTVLTAVAFSGTYHDERFGPTGGGLSQLQREGYAIYQVVWNRQYRFDLKHRCLNSGGNQMFGAASARVRMVADLSTMTDLQSRVSALEAPPIVHTIGPMSDLGIPFISPWSQWYNSAADLGRNVSFIVKGGICYLSGVARGGGADVGAMVFILPAWARPVAVRIFSVQATGSSLLAIWPDGTSHRAFK